MIIPLWKKIWAVAPLKPGHGGIDSMLMNAFIELPKENIALLWMITMARLPGVAVTPLSELSIENNGEPQVSPEFYQRYLD